MPTIPRMTAPMTAVLAFQFEGWVYQPPAGDQMCLGYLQRVLSQNQNLCNSLQCPSIA